MAVVWLQSELACIGPQLQVDTLHLSALGAIITRNRFGICKGDARPLQLEAQRLQTSPDKSRP
jgi:hypothetical protein